MVLEFLGADHEVTGSCHYVNVGDKHFLVDCGMQQGADLYENQDIPVNPSTIDYVFITHAHIDHSGLLPLIYNHGFRGQVFATNATCELCNVMLKDSAHIQMQEAEWKNRKGKRSGKSEEVTPLYDINDAQGILEHFIACEYDHKYEICDEISIRFVDAGHLLGSSSIEVWLTEGEEQRKIVFSGDIGTGNRPLIKDPEFIDKADYVLIESTYGDRVHEKEEDFAVGLAKIIQRTFDRGGNVVIPAFSVGRTQELLYFIKQIKAEQLVTGHGEFEVYMDSPLAVEATNIFHDNENDCYSDEAKKILAKGDNPLKFPGLKMAVSSDESKLINMDMKPKVIISASGMCEAGRIRHHLKHNLWRKECTIVFVGYQCLGTLGYNLLHGAQEVRLFGETVAVEASIEKLPGISGHGDMNMLLRWIGNFKKPLRRVFVVHGNEDVVDKFAALIHEKCGFDTYAPYTGDAFDLITGAQIGMGTRVKVVKKPKSSGSTVFDRLLAAGERLMAIIKKSSEMSNKDIAKFADQITNLCDKWQ